MTIKMNRDKAARMGVTPEAVMQNLVSATNSSVGFDPAFWIDVSKGNHYFIGVQYPEELLHDLDAILNIPVAIIDGVPVRLRNLATVEKSVGPGSVSHRNIGRVMDVYINVERGYDVGSVMSGIEERILAMTDELDATLGQDERGEVYRLGKYPGLSLRTQGEVKEMRNSFNQFTAGFIIAAVLVYLVMVAEFRSFVDPFVILLTVPLGFVGVVAMLMATGTNLSIMAFHGHHHDGWHRGGVLDRAGEFRQPTARRRAKCFRRDRRRSQGACSADFDDFAHHLAGAVAHGNRHRRRRCQRAARPRDHRRRHRGNPIVTAGGALFVCDI